MSQDHDGLFRHLFEDPVHAASLLRSVLGPEVSAVIDWAQLALVPGSWIDEELRSRHADLLFTGLLLLQQLPDVRELDPVAIVQRWRELFLALRQSPEWEFHGPRVFHSMYRRLETTLERLVAASDLLHDERNAMAKSLADTLIEQGHARGAALGHAKGEAEGMAEGKLELLRRLLTARFGPLPGDVEERLLQLPSEHLDALAERLFTATSLRDLFV